MRRGWFAAVAAAIGLAPAGPIAYRLPMAKPDYHTGRHDCTCAACVMARYEIAAGAVDADDARVEAVRRLMGEQFDAMVRRRPS